MGAKSGCFIVAAAIGALAATGALGELREGRVGVVEDNLIAFSRASVNSNSFDILLSITISYQIINVNYRSSFILEIPSFFSISTIRENIDLTSVAWSITQI